MKPLECHLKGVNGITRFEAMFAERTVAEGDPILLWTCPTNRTVKIQKHADTETFYSTQNTFSIAQVYAYILS